MLEKTASGATTPREEGVIGIPQTPVVDTQLSPPPNGGLIAWSQVLAGHLILCNTWGYVNSFGLFQTYYATSLNRAPSDISWVGSIQTCLIFFVGTFSGRAADAGYHRSVVTTGLGLQIIGCFCTSASTQYWQLLLAQGVCQGIGDGLAFCPTISLVSSYFTTKRTLAICCVASGAATGGIIFPIIAEQLLDSLGFVWTVRVMGFVILANATIVLALVRPRIPPRKTGSYVEWAAFKELPYTLFCIGSFLNIWATYFAYYYISSYGKTILKISSSDSFKLLIAMNAIGIPGRLIPAYLADKYFSAIIVLIPISFFAGVMIFAWIGVHNLSGLFAFAILYGFFSAGCQGIFPAASTTLTKDQSKMGVRIGMIFTIVSIACLTGPPISGALISANKDGQYLYAQIFGGLSFMCGSCTILGARIAQIAIEKKSAGKN